MSTKLFFNRALLMYIMRAYFYYSEYAQSQLSDNSIYRKITNGYPIASNAVRRRLALTAVVFKELRRVRMQVLCVGFNIRSDTMKIWQEVNFEPSMTYACRAVKPVLALLLPVNGWTQSFSHKDWRSVRGWLQMKGVSYINTYNTTNI